VRLSAHSPCGVPHHVQATRDANGSYAMIYVPQGDRTVTVDTSALSGRGLVAWWYKPGDGSAMRIGGTGPPAAAAPV
jgi:hypothetical protein